MYQWFEQTYWQSWWECLGRLANQIESTANSCASRFSQLHMIFQWSNPKRCLIVKWKVTDTWFLNVLQIKSKWIQPTWQCTNWLKSRAISPLKSNCLTLQLTVVHSINLSIMIEQLEENRCWQKAVRSQFAGGSVGNTANVDDGAQVRSTQYLTSQPTCKRLCAMNN